MQRTSVWMRSGQIFVVACLQVLSACGKTPGAMPVAVTPAEEPLMVKPIESVQDDVVLDPQDLLPVGEEDLVVLTATATRVEQVVAAQIEVVMAEDAVKEAVSTQEDDQLVVGVQQRAMVARSYAKALQVEDAADDLGLLVKQRRYARLNDYAKKYHWDLDSPPEQAKDRPQIADWWREWVDLRTKILTPRRRVHE